MTQPKADRGALQRHASSARNRVHSRLRMTKDSAAALLLLLVLLASPAPVPALCVGDCDGDGRVTVDELIRGVAIALGIVQLATCPDYTCSTPGCVVIDLLVGGVANALYGCPLTPVPTPSVATPTVPPTPASVVAALESVLYAECHPVSGVPAFWNVYATQQGYTISCQAHRDSHETVGDLVRYEDADAAARGFADAGQAGEPFAFHELPAAYWEFPHWLQLGGLERYLVWQLGCWVVTVHNFDDTHFLIAPQPAPFSEAILAAAGDLLLAECGAN
jgi:hypothetical protein